MGSEISQVQDSNILGVLQQPSTAKTLQAKVAATVENLTPDQVLQIVDIMSSATKLEARYFAIDKLQQAFPVRIAIR